jgi:hypothetical protein
MNMQFSTIIRTIEGATYTTGPVPFACFFALFAPIVPIMHRAAFPVIIFRTAMRGCHSFLSLFAHVNNASFISTFNTTKFSICLRPLSFYHLAANLTGNFYSILLIYHSTFWRTAYSFLMCGIKTFTTLRAYFVKSMRSFYANISTFKRTVSFFPICQTFCYLPTYWADKFNSRFFSHIFLRFGRRYSLFNTAVSSADQEAKPTACAAKFRDWRRRCWRDRWVLSIISHLPALASFMHREQVAALSLWEYLNHPFSSRPMMCPHNVSYPLRVMCDVVPSSDQSPVPRPNFLVHFSAIIFHFLSMPISYHRYITLSRGNYATG